MAVLSTADRQELWAEFMRSPEAGETFALLKGEGRVVVDALDDFMQANATAVNNAIPQPARAALTTAQKARLLLGVVRWRYLKGA